jgi:hypothetical protein
MPLVMLKPTPYRREARKRMELLAMQMVMETEKQLGNQPRDVSAEKCGYDIESKVEANGKLRFIEVKGRVAGATNCDGHPK